ncbi:unnamed protein product [Microthlaspi erraticum]|uniref:Uncharacterized protein n=1 Tax=Microthlaspi erraticum TaxID=1685480 RepID=A0A6D2I2L7_9BRAS|nr:unnamed protein product [Microthlaspi erraticum]
MAKLTLVLMISFSVLLFTGVLDATKTTNLPPQTKGLYRSRPSPWSSENTRQAPPAETTKGLDRSGPSPGSSDNPPGAPPVARTTNRLLLSVAKPPRPAPITKTLF